MKRKISFIHPILTAVLLLSFTVSFGQLAPSINYTVPAQLTTGVVVSFLPTNTGGPILSQAYVKTIAGNESPTNYGLEGNALDMEFGYFTAMVYASSGDLFFFDAMGDGIRKISPTGQVTNFVGGGVSGYIRGMSIDSQGNIYGCDIYGHVIRKITPGGVVTTFAGQLNTSGYSDGVGGAARFSQPSGIAIDANDNLYILDSGNKRIRKVTPAGAVSTLAGNGNTAVVNGSGASASFRSLSGIDTDSQGNVYVSEYSDHVIRKITPLGIVSTYAGVVGSGSDQDGTGSSARFYYPGSLSIDKTNDDIYVAQGNARIRKVTASLEISTIIGNSYTYQREGLASEVSYEYIDVILWGADGGLLIGDSDGNAMGYLRRYRKDPYMIVPALPDGMTFDKSTGEISGIPLQPTPLASYEVTAHNYAGKNSTAISFSVSNGVIDPDPEELIDQDKHLNWDISQVFDEEGNVVAETKTFYDNAGRDLQTQQRNMATDDIVAAQDLYDPYGRVAISTMPAPINSSSFAYKPDFVKGSAGVYNYNNFEWNKERNPDALAANEQGTLGWYYSNNNTLDPYQATTGYPYSRVTYYKDGSGIKENFGAGDEMRSGKGRSVRSNVTPVGHELQHYIAIYNRFIVPYLNQNSSVPSDTLSRISATQTVSTDVDGRQYISISDASGRLLMVARADENGILVIENTRNVDENRNRYTATFNAETDGSSRFSIYSPHFLFVKTGSSFYYSGIGDNCRNYLAAPGITYTIESDYPFRVNNKQSIEIVDSSFGVLYFNLLQSDMPFGESGDYELRDMDNEDYASDYSSPGKGYYKLSVLEGDALVSYTNKVSDISYTFYNDIGQPVANLDPMGVENLIQNGLEHYSDIHQLPFTTLQEYDLRGRVVTTTSTETGRTEYIYRNDNAIRFSQNAKQRQTGAFSYSVYDSMDRPIEGGVYAGTLSFSGLKTNTSIIESRQANGGLTGGTRKDVVKTHYDTPDNAHGLPNYSQDAFYLRSAVSWTENEHAKTWYNYDENGRIVWTIKQINGLGTKTTDYTYNVQGGIAAIDYQRHVPAERLVYHYTYDAGGNPTTVYTSTDSINKIRHSYTEYTVLGTVKRVELGNKLQGIDYVYTVDGKLKAVNHADKSKDPGKDGTTNGFAPDVFGMNFEYFANDYQRAGTNISSIQNGSTASYYGGLLNGVSWHTLKPSSVSGPNNPVMNTYVYDNKYQLLRNNWGTPNFTTGSFTVATNVNQERNLTYDAHGNIKTLTRTNPSGSVLANYQYNYTVNTNKLASVSNYASYTYDALGQLASETKGSLSKYLDYDVFGRVTKIYSNAAKTNAILSFAYDENGSRIKKQDHLQNVTTWYVDGNVYNGNQLIEQPIPSGIFYRSGNVYRYQLTDHVGSVRALINRNKLGNGNADIVYYADYYPFGKELQTAGIPSRYGYQGEYAEKDGETGWNNFYLRNYDPAIGRWLSIDPYGQYASPYVGMGNNPVSGFDPDGGWSSGGGDPPVKKTIRLPEVVVTGKTNNSFVLPNYIPKNISPVLETATYARYLALGASALSGFILMHSTSEGPKPQAIEFINDYGNNVQFANAIKNNETTKNNREKVGSYTIFWKGGTKYHGKGPMNRMLESAAERTIELHGLGVLSENAVISGMDWSPSVTDREAFKAEYRRMQTDAVPVIIPEGYQNPINLNRIQSPGKGYIMMDGY